jgi:hypothetical protein
LAELRCGRINKAKRRIRMILTRQLRWQGALFACGLSAVLAGCSSSSVNNLVDIMPREVGLPADAPERPAGPPAYPAVHDMPPPRSATTLSAEEQIKLEDELIAVRTRQEIATNPAPSAARRRPPPAAPAPPVPRIIPATSSNTIY